MNKLNDPGAPAAAARVEPLLQSPHTHLALKRTEVRLGTAGWTDATLTAAGVFYPENIKSAEDRLRYYASLFPMVEVDSSYYALPSARNAQLWVERTPPHFIFNVKAFALMTGHPAEVTRLPSFVADNLPDNARQKPRIYARNLPDDTVNAVWSEFRNGVQPLHSAGKLGSILLQYPRWFLANRESATELRRARERLGDLPASVEFRNARWLAPANADRTFTLLRELDFSYVCVDEPQGLASSVPPLLEVTNTVAFLRLHGRKAEAWEKRGATVAERFRYLYTADELRDLARSVETLAERAEKVYVVFNNCYANYGTTNALEIGAFIKSIYNATDL